MSAESRAFLHLHGSKLLAIVSELESTLLKGDNIGIVLRAVKGDTGSLDDSSFQATVGLPY